MFEAILVESWWRGDGLGPESIPRIAIAQRKRGVGPVRIMCWDHCQHQTVRRQKRIVRIVRVTVRIR